MENNASVGEAPDLAGNSILDGSNPRAKHGDKSCNEIEPLIFLGASGRAKGYYGTLRAIRKSELRENVLVLREKLQSKWRMGHGTIRNEASVLY